MDIMLDEQASVLPYDEKFEIPEKQLVLRKNKYLNMIK